MFPSSSTQFEIIRKLSSQGAHGSIFLARNNNSNNDENSCTIIIKQLPASISSYHTESRVMQNLSAFNHPHIVRHIHSWVDTDANANDEHDENKNTSSATNKLLNIAMEFCKGGDLRCAIREKRQNGSQDPDHFVGFPEPIIKKWLFQLFSALHFLHSQDIIHRDIKTGNILLDDSMFSLSSSSSSPNVKLADFGFIKEFAHSDEFGRSFLGTPCYVAPELCEGSPYNNRADIWSLGIVLFELMTLQRPFCSPPPSSTNQQTIATTQRELYRSIRRDEPKPIRATSNNRYSSGLYEIVDRILNNKDPRFRPSARDLMCSWYFADEIPRMMVNNESGSLSTKLFLEAAMKPRTEAEVLHEEKVWDSICIQTESLDSLAVLEHVLPGFSVDVYDQPPPPTTTTTTTIASSSSSSSPLPKIIMQLKFGDCIEVLEELGLDDESNLEARWLKTTRGFCPRFLVQRKTVDEKPTFKNYFNRVANWRIVKKSDTLNVFRHSSSSAPLPTAPPSENEKENRRNDEEAALLQQKKLLAERLKTESIDVQRTFDSLVNGDNDDDSNNNNKQFEFLSRALIHAGLVTPDMSTILDLVLRYCLLANQQQQNTHHQEDLSSWCLHCCEVLRPLGLIRWIPVIQKFASLSLKMIFSSDRSRNNDAADDKTSCENTLLMQFLSKHHKDELCLKLNRSSNNNNYKLMRHEKKTSFYNNNNNNSRLLITVRNNYRHLRSLD